jgi:2-keto-3-deoxy-L-rhamnonate aldolase RhmA
MGHHPVVAWELIDDFATPVSLIAVVVSVVSLAILAEPSVVRIITAATWSIAHLIATGSPAIVIPVMIVVSVS